MRKQELKIIAQKIINAEREIKLGKDIELNEEKIQNYMQTIPLNDLIKVTEYIDNKEIF